jgi:carboxymethylenebutenolidase
MLLGVEHARGPHLAELARASPALRRRAHTPGWAGLGGTPCALSTGTTWSAGSSAEVKMTPVSRTADERQIVDELVISFTPTAVIDWMLPEIAPTGRPVQAAFVVVVGFANGKITHEHIYWDQANVLVKIGLLEPGGLPVVSAESAHKVLNSKLPRLSL